MTKRYRITVHMTGNGNEYDIEHEADTVLLDVASRLYFGDPGAKRKWEPYTDIWPDLMQIEENDDGAPGFEMLRHFDDDPDRWPGRQAFWSDAMHSGVKGVGRSFGEFPGGSELFRIQGQRNFDRLIKVLKDKYEFMEGGAWV